MVEQPYGYARRELAEPDWRRLPGWAGVTRAEWESAQWQRAHSVKNLRQLRDVVGDGLTEACYADLERDQRERATMSMLIPPQLLNTIVPALPASAASFTAEWYADPVRRYMLPMFSDRRADWPSHPFAQRDSLHEAEMWAVEGLTHRYPTKVLAELVPTCPQYCGHCTRMDLVGNPTASYDKHRFGQSRDDRLAAMLSYLRNTPEVRDVVVSGGDVANLPWPRLEAFVAALLEIESVRDIRLASKAVMGLPQHWLSDDVLAGMTRLASTARSRGVSLAVHTHVNAAQSVTPLVARAARALLDAGVRDVRNQGVLLRGVNDSPGALLDLCFALLDGASVTPYYFYMCDMIPGAEHWRLSLAEAQGLQTAIMGYLPGFATPRVVCDVPYVGKRWVHQVGRYDTVRGISYWTKNYRTALEAADPLALDREYPYYDPIHLLPADGQRWWRDQERPAPARSAPLAVIQLSALAALSTGVTARRANGCGDHTSAGANLGRRTGRLRPSARSYWLMRTGTGDPRPRECARFYRHRSARTAWLPRRRCSTGPRTPDSGGEVDGREQERLPVPRPAQHARVAGGPAARAAYRDRAGHGDRP